MTPVRVLTALAGACVVAAAMAVPAAAAELQYTVHLEAHASSVPAAPPTSPVLALLGPMVVGVIAPPGGLDTTITVGARGMRVDYPVAYLMIPAGGSMITRPDGSIVVLDPAAKTYWKMAGLSASTAAAGVKPTVEVKRTGTFATIAGLQAEHATVTIHAALPVSVGAGMPGLPSELVITGEAWLSDRYKQYSGLTSSLVGGTGVLGLNPENMGGFLVRALLRGELFGPQELETVVTHLVEITAPANYFDIPAGFTEVQPPAPGPLALPSMH
jgi:hypothetical protein